MTGEPARITSGKRRLDAILGGGLPEHTINVIAGAPGTGKTMLAQQFFFANTSAERPGVYLSTVSEPMDKLIRFGQSLSFFDRDAIGRSVFYDDLGETLNTEGLPGVSARITEIVRSRRPGVIVIDSFKALAEFATSAAEYRRFLHDLAGMSDRDGEHILLGWRVQHRRHLRGLRERGRGHNHPAQG